MTLKELLYFAYHPEELTEASLPALKDLVQQYPYFQLARLLYTLNLHQVQDSAFPAALKLASACVHDKKHLFFLLQGSEFEALRKQLQTTEQGSKSFALIESFLADTMETESLIPEYLLTPSKLELTTAVPYTLDSIPQEREESNPLIHQDIIDQFLDKDREAPLRITLTKTDTTEVDSSELAANSSIPVGETPFFSETLAKIYIKQRKYQKAVEIIQKLSLLYPEKSVYFADQIRFLNKLITNAKK